MLKIRRLQLILPAGFTGSPERVARLVAEELARHHPLPAETGERIGRLAPPAIELGRRPGEHEIAGTVARTIHGEIARR